MFKQTVPERCDKKCCKHKQSITQKSAAQSRGHCMILCISFSTAQIVLFVEVSEEVNTPILR